MGGDRRTDQEGQADGGREVHAVGERRPGGREQFPAGRAAEPGRGPVSGGRRDQDLGGGAVAEAHTLPAGELQIDGVRDLVTGQHTDLLART